MASSMYSASRVIAMVTLLYTLVTHIDHVRGDVKLIDLSHEHDEDTLMSPDNPPYLAATINDGPIGGVYVKIQRYSLGEHGGTHMDAPRHFNPDGDGLEAITLQDSIAPGVMIDVSQEVAKDQGYAITVEKLKEWEDENGRIPNKAAVIINFGWSKHFKNKAAYFGAGEDLEDYTKYIFPRISKEAGYWLADERDTKILAVDTACPDGMKASFPVHVKFLTLSRRLIVENIFDPERLPATGFQFVATPVKFVGGTGVQVRAFAMVESSDALNIRSNFWFITGLLIVFSFLVL